MPICWDKGFVALPRGLTDWEWYEDANTTRLYIHLLLTANWTTTQWRGITVHPGQKVTSLAHLAQETGLSVQNVRTSLNRMVSTNYLTIKTTNQYSVITIKNADKHFAPNKQPTGQLTNPQQQSYHIYQTNRRLSSSICTHAGVQKDRTTTSPLVSEYERQIGKLGERARAELDAFGQQLGRELTVEILRKCADLGAHSWAYVRKALAEAQAQGCTSPEEYRRTHPIGSGRAKRVDRETPSGKDFLQDASARRRRMKKERPDKGD